MPATTSSTGTAWASALKAVTHVMKFVAAVSTAAVGMAASAHADDRDGFFFGVLDGAGIEYADPREAIEAAKAVCVDLQAHPVNVTVRSLNLANPNLSPAYAAQFVAISKEAYCPAAMFDSGGGG